MNEIVSTHAEVVIVQANYPADRNPALVYMASLKESTRRPVKESLNLIANMVLPGSDHINFAWHLVRYQHSQAIRTALAARYSAGTANRHLSALRGALKEAWRLGYTTAEDYRRAVDFKAVKGETAKAAEKGRHIKSGEFIALLGACEDGTNAGVRDACIIAIGYVCGLRRAEIAALTMEDFNAEDATLRVAHGKGNVERIMPVGSDGLDYLGAWLAVRDSGPGALFCRINKGDVIDVAGMTPQAIYYILNRRIEEAKIKSFAPHDLRRTFAGDLLDNGSDLSTVQKMMGHKNPITTSGYDRRDQKAKRKAADTLHLPKLNRGVG